MDTTQMNDIVNEYPSSRIVLRKLVISRSTVMQYEGST